VAALTWGMPPSSRQASSTIRKLALAWGLEARVRGARELVLVLPALAPLHLVALEARLRLQGHTARAPKHLL